MAQYRFNFPSELASEDKMLDKLKACLDKARVPESVQQPILLTISEAFTNAMTHGNGLDPKKMVVMELQVNDSEITADIIDEGVGGLSRIDSHTPRGLLAESGRGLNLMRHYAGKVAITETERGGVRVSMTYTFERESETCQ